VLLEPLATDTLFVAAPADRVRRRFAARGTYLVVDRTDSLTNPHHNFTKLRYEGFSYLPAVPPEWLRRASADYPGTVRQCYSQFGHPGAVRQRLPARGVQRARRRLHRPRQRRAQLGRSLFPRLQLDLI